MNIEFTSAYEQSDKSHPEWNPLLYLGWKGSDGNEITIRYGAAKFNDIYESLDKVGKDLAAHDRNNGIFHEEIVFHEGAKYGSWKEVFTEKKYLIYDHYRDDIKKYVDKYYVPYTPKGRPLYETPVAEVYEDEKCNVKWVLRVPCYPAEPNDTGKGLRAWSVTEFMASVYVRDAEGGQLFSKVRNNLKMFPGQKYEFKHVYGLKETPFELSPEQQKAFVDYYDTFLKFVINPQSLA